MTSIERTPTSSGVVESKAYRPPVAVVSLSKPIETQKVAQPAQRRPLSRRVSTGYWTAVREVPSTHGFSTTDGTPVVVDPRHLTVLPDLLNRSLDSRIRIRMAGVARLDATAAIGDRSRGQSTVRRRDCSIPDLQVDASEMLAPLHVGFLVVWTATLLERDIDAVCVLRFAGNGVYAPGSPERDIHVFGPCAFGSDVECLFFRLSRCLVATHSRCGTKR